MTPQEYLESYRIYLRDDVNGEMLKAFDAQVDEYVKEHPTLDHAITIVITSPGGNSIVGRSLYERVRLLSGQVDTNIIAIGDCSSAATIIYVAVARDKRFTTKHTHFLVHEMSRSSSEVREGSVRQRDLDLEYVQKAQEWMLADYAWMIGIMAPACECSEETFRSWCEATLHFTGAEAVEMKLAGALVENM